MRRPSFFQPTLDEPVIHLTPLVDVVFVVLIMFIVIAPLVELEQVQLVRGAQETTSLPTAGQIRIYVHRDNHVTLNGTEVALGRLKESLSQLRQRYPQETPKLFHDQEASFGTYQAVKNSAEEAGFMRIDLVVEPR